MKAYYEFQHCFWPRLVKGILSSLLECRKKILILVKPKTFVQPTKIGLRPNVELLTFVTVEEPNVELCWV